MRSFRIALAFLRDRRLFCQLLLWPLILGVFLATGQIFISAAYLHLLEETPEQFKQRVETRDGTVDWIQGVVHGKSKLPPQPEVCTWQRSGAVEVPPSADCHLETLDVTIRKSADTPADLQKFVQYFSLATHRIHVCEECSSDIIIDFQNGVTSSKVSSLRALGVFILAQDNRNNDVNEFFGKAKEKSQELEDLTGTVLLRSGGMQNAMDMTHATIIMVFVINTCMLIVASLWLTLNGYRKVLRCFAENNALLPLVAVCGKWEFYLSIWIITLFRVSLFILISIPLSILAYHAAVPVETRALFMPEQTTFIAWLFAVSSSLALVTVIASLSELLRRHSFWSIIYRYVPLVLVIGGTLLWIYSLFAGDSQGVLFAAQKALVYFPVIGLSPVILTPVLSQPAFSLLVHGIIATVLVWFLLKRHAIWFAAHLEEV